jgi:hypothetical protein
LCKKQKLPQYQTISPSCVFDIVVAFAVTVIKKIGLRKHIFSYGLKKIGLKMYLIKNDMG